MFRNLHRRGDTWFFIEHLICSNPSLYYLSNCSLKQGDCRFVQKNRIEIDPYLLIILICLLYWPGKKY